MHRVKVENRKPNFGSSLNRLSALLLQNPSNTLNVYDYRDLAYYIQVTIGSDNQTFLVVPDTGSSMFWVPDSKCTSSVCSAKHRFHHNTSTSYIPSKQNFSIQYGTGNACGNYGIDTVGVGNPPVFSVTNCYVGQATEVADFFKQNPEFDGVFGLGPLQRNGVDSPILQAFKLGILPQLFTIYLEQDGDNASGTQGGVITWGAIDTVNCEKMVDYVPLLTSDLHWAFNFTSVCYKEYCNNEVMKAITDTGTSLIHGPYYIVDKILKEMGVNTTDNTIPCNAEVQPLVLKIGGKEYKLPKEMIIREVKEDGVTCCMPLLKPIYNLLQNYWLLGDPFIHQYCQIHDLGNKRIGFALSKRTEI